MCDCTLFLSENTLFQKFQSKLIDSNVCWIVYSIGFENMKHLVLETLITLSINKFVSLVMLLSRFYRFFVWCILTRAFNCNNRSLDAKGKMNTHTHTYKRRKWYFVHEPDYQTHCSLPFIFINSYILAVDYRGAHNDGNIKPTTMSVNSKKKKKEIHRQHFEYFSKMIKIKFVELTMKSLHFKWQFFD